MNLSAVVLSVAVCASCLPHPVARYLVEGPKAEAKDQLAQLVTKWDAEMEARIHEISLRVAHRVAEEAKAVGGDLDDAVAKASESLSDEISGSLTAISSGSEAAFAKLVEDVKSAAFEKLQSTAASTLDADEKVVLARLDTDREIRMSTARSAASTWAAGELKIELSNAGGALAQCRAATVEGVDCEAQYRTALRASDERIEAEVRRRIDSAKLEIETALADERKSKLGDLKTASDAWRATEEKSLLEKLTQAGEAATSRASKVVADKASSQQLRSVLRASLKGVVGRKVDGIVSEDAIASQIEEHLHQFLRHLERHTQSELEKLLDKAGDELVNDLSKHW